ncbi:MAG TPA: dodecin family protein [Verrucomicrobiae bacterium]
MAVVKVIEILAQSPKSWEDAAQMALTEVSKTVQGVQSLYIKNLQAVVENGKISEYRIDAKISFVVRDEKREK